MSPRFNALEIGKFTLVLPSSTPQPKERRKGKKEIHRDNLETLAFYRKFSVAGTVSGCEEGAYTKISCDSGAPFEVRIQVEDGAARRCLDACEPS